MMAELSALAAHAEALNCSPNHAARVAGLAIFDRRRGTVVEAKDGMVAFTDVANGDAVLNLHFKSPIAAIDLLPVWRAEWSADASLRVILPAVPAVLVPASGRAFAARGRAVTFEEPCQTWEADDATWAAVCAGLGVDSSTVSAPSAETLAAAWGLPSDLQLAPLRVEDASTVNAHWKYRSERSEEMLRDVIAHQPTAGCWKGGVLVSWIVLRQDGSMGVLHTLPEYRGQGLAKAVVKFLMLQLRLWANRAAVAAAADASGGGGGAAAVINGLWRYLRPYCHIKIGNEASESLFKSLGFKTVGKVTWVISSALLPRFRLRPLATSSEAEWARLLSFINTSYKQDDAFFVDQTRTDLGTIQCMAREGVFYVGYKLSPGSALYQSVVAPDASSGCPVLQPYAVPGAYASSYAVPPAACTMQEGETQDLLCCVYIKVRDEIDPDAVSEAAADGSSSGGGSSISSGKQPATGSRVFPHQLPSTDPSAASASSVSADGSGVAADAACASVSASGSPAPSPRAAGHRRVASISMLTIDPAYKKCGYGQRVLDCVTATARDSYGCSHLEAYVVSVKPWLVGFYRDRNNFVQVGTEPWPEVIKYQLLLPCYFHHMVKRIV